MSIKYHKDLEELEKQLEKRAKIRQKRKKHKMRVSGKSVFGLQKIIQHKMANIDRKI